MSRSRKGFAVVLSAPSGGGKDTVAESLLRELPFLVKSRSVTTRTPRSGEEAGREYRFISQDEFDEMKSSGKLLEWATVHGYEYGTPKSFVEEICEKGKCALLVIDVQGGLAVKEKDPRSMLVFLMPPSLAEVERRLRGRGTESEKDIQKRLANARREVEEAAKYDLVVVNASLEAAIGEVRGALEKVYSLLTR